jgi:hypothetical protein
MGSFRARTPHVHRHFPFFASFNVDRSANRGHSWSVGISRYCLEEPEVPAEDVRGPRQAEAEVPRERGRLLSQSTPGVPTQPVPGSEDDSPEAMESPPRVLSRSTATRRLSLLALRIISRRVKLSRLIRHLWAFDSGSRQYFSQSLASRRTYIRVCHIKNLEADHTTQLDDDFVADSSRTKFKLLDPWHIWQME